MASRKIKSKQSGAKRPCATPAGLREASSDEPGAVRPQERASPADKLREILHSHKAARRPAKLRDHARTLCRWHQLGEGRCKKAARCRRNHNFDRAANPPTPCHLGVDCPFLLRARGNWGCMFYHPPSDIVHRRDRVGDRLEVAEMQLGAVETMCGENSAEIANLQSASTAHVAAYTTISGELFCCLEVTQRIAAVLAGLISEMGGRHGAVQNLLTLRGRLAAAVQRLAVAGVKLEAVPPSPRATAAAAASEGFRRLLEEQEQQGCTSSHARPPDTEKNNG
jgi:hypothetical protein